MSDWIKNLKVGDLVIVSTRYDEVLRKVDRITKAGNIGVGAWLFNSNGIERNGDTWSKASLYEATPQKVNQIRERQIIKKAYNLMKNAHEINIGQALKIIEILGDKTE